MTPPGPGSLRERKRRATMLAIEEAATSLVLEHGYDVVTVDQICDAADVSKRTFFNYVPTKEAAVVGTPPVTVPETDRVAFLDSTLDDVPHALLRLFLGVFAAARIGDDAQAARLVQRRRRIFRAEPDLGVARMTASSRLQLQLVDLVTELYGLRPALRRLEGVPAEAEARACVALVAASANLGLSTWLTRTNATFDLLDDECATALGQLALLASPDPHHTPGSPS